jgi:8-oxo-dGTP diphosphatase
VAAILLTVHVVVFSVSEDRLRVLLTPRHLPPLSTRMGAQTPVQLPSNSSNLGGEKEGGLSLPGVEVKTDESLDDAAARAVAPYVDRRQAYLEQLYTYGDARRVSPEGRSVSVAYFALVPAHALAKSAADGEAWFPLLALPAVADDHAEIIAYALRRVRYKLEYSAAAFQLMPEEFSLSELQHTYEIILGEKLDKRNFRRRILEAGIIEPTSHRRSGEGRPARLYRYRPDAVAEVKARRLFP